MRGAGRRLPERHRDDRLVAGVCAGLARWLGVDPVVLRVVFVVLALSGGSGVVAYAVLWLLMPDERGGALAGRRRRDRAVERGAGPRRTESSRRARDGRASWERSQRVVALVLLVLGFLLLLRELGLWVGDRLVWPAVLAGAGLALAWPDAAPEEPPWRPFTDKITGRRREPELAAGGRLSLVRVGLGLLAVVAGAVVFAAANADLDALGDALLAAALTVVGVLLIFGPWGWRLGRDLVAERRRRIRMEERAEMAARVHDSVLQTLALIQQQSDDPAETARLARRQERELRRWLFDDAGARPGTVKAAVAALVSEVEELFPVEVDAVVVGDGPLEAGTEALLAAAKEALVNAGKFSGEATVSLYVEVEPSEVTAFVRDRGVGFEPAVVPSDRRGLVESIRGRMERHEGSAEIRSAPGEGTEVELWVSRGTRTWRA